MSADTPIVLLSSSPIPTFARSQTPVDLGFDAERPDETCPSSYTDSAAQIPGSSFKTTTATRDSFSTSFTSARSILGARSSAENVPLHKSPPKPISIPPVCSESKQNGRTGGSGWSRACWIEQSGPERSVTNRNYVKQSQRGNHDEPSEYQTRVVKVQSGDIRRKKKNEYVDTFKSPITAARTKSWTSVPEINEISAFGKEMSTVWTDPSCPDSHPANTSGCSSTKRRKLDSAPPLATLKSVSKTTKAKGNSPVKKALTITGLATAVFNDRQDEPSPIAQFLVSTQANISEETNPDTFQIKIKSKKSSKKRKSRLASPNTAQKSYDSQDFIFASGSQLARDESPTFIRDTIAAIRQSEQDCDIPLTQHTTTFSEESTTPQKSGLARFHSSRRLWTAAHRDEDDALLHLDDDFDLPNIKEFFAGKDAKVDTASSVPALDGFADSLSLLDKLNREAGSVLKEMTEIIDSDEGEPHTKVTARREMPTTGPPVPKSQSRAYSTHATPTSSRRAKETPSSHNPNSKVQKAHSTALMEPDSLSCNNLSDMKRPPSKPNYSLWTDEQLKTEVKTLGFKRLRARKSMIDKLDEHFASEYGLDPARVKAATKAVSKSKKLLQQDDILNRVHDLAKRPEPKKPKQPRKKKKETSRSIVVQRNDIENISDIDISHVSAFDRLAALEVPQSDTDDSLDMALEPPVSTAPVKGTGVGRTSKHPPRLLTPPPTRPPEPTQTSSPAFEAPTRLEIPESPASLSDISSPTSPDVDIKSQILPALLNPPPDHSTRNEQVNPTWYQKILMYDPIVLEDFTAWLNTEGFNAISEDREVDAQVVKEWCHENGVCCLWRGGWRGNKKKGKDGE